MCSSARSPKLTFRGSPTAHPRPLTTRPLRCPVSRWPLSSPAHRTGPSSGPTSGLSCSSGGRRPRRLRCAPLASPTLLTLSSMGSTCGYRASPPARSNAYGPATGRCSEHGRGPAVPTPSSPPPAGYSSLPRLPPAGQISLPAQPPPAGKIYVINPDAAPAAVTVFESDIGDEPIAITYDGANLWTANVGSMAGNGSISRVNAATALDSTFTTGFARPWDIFWDGANLWVADGGDNHLKLVDPSSGAVLESIAIDNQPRYLLFDGTNIWVTNFDSNSISVVRAVGSLRGTVLATLTGNGLAFPQGMAFDGERVMVCNNGNGGSLSLFRAADFTPLVNMSTGASSAPRAACSDGVNFWIARTGNNDIARF